MGEAANLAFECAGEGALFVAKQLRFDQIGRDRTAVDHEHRALAARRRRVNGLRDHFLARAALALDENRNARSCGLGGDG